MAITRSQKESNRDNSISNTRNSNLKNSNCENSIDSSSLRRSKRETLTKKAPQLSATLQKSRQNIGTKIKLKKRNLNLIFEAEGDGTNEDELRDCETLRPPVNAINNVTIEEDKDSEENIIKISDHLFEKFKHDFFQILKFGDDQNLNLDIILLAKSCITALKDLEFNLDILLEKCKILSSILSHICSYDQTNFKGIPSIIAILEVFIKGAIENPDITNYLIYAKNANSFGEKLLEPSRSFSKNLSLIQELISHHFLLSFPKQTYHTFSQSLCDKITLELGLGLDSSLALLSTNLSSPMPYILQAHLSILATQYINTLKYDKSCTIDLARSAFELSSKLYKRSLFDFELNNGISIITSGDLRCKVGDEKQFPCIKAVAGNALENNMNNMILFLQNEYEIKSRDDFLSSLFCYIEESKNMVHEDFRDQSNHILKSMVSKFILSDKIRGVECKITQELVSLAASLKLMGSSILHVLSQLRENNGEYIQEINNSKEQEKNSVIWRRFSKIEANEIIKRVFIDVLGEEDINNKRSLLLLRHFGDLLMFGLKTRVEFLAKACVFVIMAVLDLVAFEEESLDIFNFLILNKEKIANSLQKETTKGSFCKRTSSARIAKEFLKVKSLCNESKWMNNEESQSETAKCDGKAYLNCLPEYNKNPSEYDDLVDFIVCDEDKDYSMVIKNRDKFRQFLVPHRISHAKRKRSVSFATKWGRDTRFRV